jgi:hypothetical protein
MISLVAQMWQLYENVLQAYELGCTDVPISGTYSAVSLHRCGIGQYVASLSVWFD